jgi:hypothetical protein
MDREFFIVCSSDSFMQHVKLRVATTICYSSLHNIGVMLATMGDLSEHLCRDLQRTVFTVNWYYSL